ncbi:hypothetical protein DRE_02897 [Drechslerella stenobrocha 248]|uniref:CRIB domain-containing protein n=1 Tax=Drechslerella stenobrocha 248 TaxID=1043628 RepID=W7I5F1_9PEZI|nr:hypothetical protein DRE_02897 [Drechslerella stenobrocha 248]
MFSRLRETGRQIARSNSISNDPSIPTQESHRYQLRLSSEKRRYSVAAADTTPSPQNSSSPGNIKNMDRPGPQLRKRGSSLFNKMTSQETYESLVPRSTSSSRSSERLPADNRDSPFPSLSTRIKAHRMRKNSQLSLSLGPLEEHEIRQPTPTQRNSTPRLLRTHSVPDLLSKAQASSNEPRTFCNGKPISNPFNFRHLSHLKTQQGAQFEDTPEDVLPLQWNYMLKEARAPKTPVVPMTPLTPRTPRNMLNLSGSLRTTGLPMPSPSVDSVYSPVDSIAELSMKSRSAESLNNSYTSHLAPPPRSSSRAAFSSFLDTKEDDIPILESEGRDSVILFPADIALLPRSVDPILEDESSMLDQDTKDIVLGAFPSPPVASPLTSGLPIAPIQPTAAPHVSSVQLPNFTATNQLLPPLSPLRPSSSSSGTLGVGSPSDGNQTKEPALNRRSSKRSSKRFSRRVSSLLGESVCEIQNWEADIDWTYDNTDLDEWVDDLEGIEEEEEVGVILGSKSAPVSASPSAVNLACLDEIAVKRHSDEGTSFLSAPEDDNEPRSPGIGIADRLPNLKAGRKHYRNSSLRAFSNLDNGIVTLNEADELQHQASFQMVPAAPREVAIPPARYSGRSRAASNATCTTSLSDIEGYPSDLSEMASTPSHSSHNSAEGPYFLPHTQDGLYTEAKAQLVSGVHIVSDDVPFNFF